MFSKFLGGFSGALMIIAPAYAAMVAAIAFAGSLNIVWFIPTGCAVAAAFGLWYAIDTRDR